MVYQTLSDLSPSSSRVNFTPGVLESRNSQPSSPHSIIHLPYPAPTLPTHSPGAAAHPVADTVLYYGEEPGVINGMSGDKPEDINVLEIVHIPGKKNIPYVCSS